MRIRIALTYFLVAAVSVALAAETERRSWNQIRYVGGSIPMTTSRYDWNATLTVTANPDTITLTIAPAKLFASKQTVHIDPAKVISLSEGDLAWQQVSAVPGSKLPPRKQTLFGFLDHHSWAGVVYETDDGKRAGILLDSLYAWQFLRALNVLTHKEIEHSP